MAAMLSTMKDCPERSYINPVPCTFKNIILFPCAITGARPWSPGVWGGLWPQEEDSAPSRPTQTCPGFQAPHLHLSLSPQGGSLCSPFPHLSANAKLLPFTFQGLFRSISPFCPFSSSCYLHLLSLALPHLHSLPPSIPFVFPSRLLARSFHAFCAWISLLKPHLAYIHSFFLPPFSPSQN